MDFAKKCRWAQKAAPLSKQTTDSDEEYVRFYQLAQDSGLGTRWLAYYSNAYEAAGESGIKALTYRKKLPEIVRSEALNKINKYLDEKRQFLRSKNAQIDFETKYSSNRITVYEKEPLFHDPSETSCIAVFQVRYTDYDNRWHLYWMRKFHQWWPYVPEQHVYTIDDCIREVKQDTWGCFWG
jgi:hypothetical protein